MVAATVRKQEILNNDTLKIPKWRHAGNWKASVFYHCLTVLCFSSVGAVRDFGISNQDGLKIDLIIYSDGLVFFSQPTTIQSACALNIADFPFDDQTCQLTFGSWTMDYTLLKLDLNKGGVDLTYFIENNMWDLLEISPSVRSQVYFSHDDALSTVVYSVVVRRKALFYVVNYIAPPVAISFLSLLLFLIPPEVGKRMGKNCYLQLTPDNSNPR